MSPPPPILKGSTPGGGPRHGRRAFMASTGLWGARLLGAALAGRGLLGGAVAAPVHKGAVHKGAAHPAGVLKLPARLGRTTRANSSASFNHSGAPKAARHQSATLESALQELRGAPAHPGRGARLASNHPANHAHHAPAIHPQRAPVLAYKNPTTMAGRGKHLALAHPGQQGHIQHGKPQVVALKAGHGKVVAVHGRHQPTPHLPLIVLDPGHGGHDPGATGRTGIHEKAITLIVAHELRRRLEAGKRFRVMMTRTTDRYVSLEGRVAFAQAHHANIFLSLHADALPPEAAAQSVRGASVYTLSGRASDPQSAWLATSQNAVDGGLASFSARSVPLVLRHILSSLERDGTRRLSRQLQESLVGGLGQKMQLLHHPARQAGFAVLRSGMVPSALVEMGFLSNIHDEALLLKPLFRRQVAAALAQALEQYSASKGLA
ncbi:N-acetylmuramoyl-L-alanine amidase [Formicincola oecophyllae]|uniref:N-acetylmuramoyl-L-alanine amidase n=1 Tax=Formicincola oecophyllae TaxID=2558361 RepID=A0A4Y6UBJ6_9PROT|nr:N-acetylmuramoyl-L-alanine amidase [Formicincola oecophyllae]QDH13837.1 N-acetylmuramoyl-L-alanine amidase [Formicincola oecophyllae]